MAVVMEEDAVPVRPDVRGAREPLGLDPLYVACEGRMVAIVSAAVAGGLLSDPEDRPG